MEYKFKDKRRTHQIVSVANSAPLQQILNRAKVGATLIELAAEITEEAITLDMAMDFVAEMVSEQVLVSNLEPSITGKEFLEQIIETLTVILTKDESVLVNLQEIQSLLVKLNLSPPGSDIEAYTAIIEKIKELPTLFEAGKLFQVDMAKPMGEGAIGEQTLQDIQQGIEILNLFTVEPKENNLSKFQEAFFERYEEREVSLLEVLDTESGIGYPINTSLGDIATLVDNLTIGIRKREHSLAWNNIQSFLLKIYMEAFQYSRYQVSLTPKDIETLKGEHKQEKPLPDTLAVMVSILEGNGVRNPKDIIHLMSAGGSSAANLLGRFCYTDKEILGLVKEITAKEQAQNPNVIYAEIVHLPEARVGNILLRPQVREYEIPYLAKASVDEEHTIAINDLFLSVKQNRLVLRSKRLNKEIVPRLSSAHNYSAQSLPVYHFLCDMQNQSHKGGVGFGWGSLEGQFMFLPRVVYENLVLSLAQWNLRKEDFAEILKYKEPENEQAFSNWRKKFKFPRYVALADGDNELVLDLQNKVCQMVFIETIKNREAIKLVEFIFNPKNAVVKGPEGSYVNQFIVPFYKNEGTGISLPLSKSLSRLSGRELEGVSVLSNKITTESTVKRTFSPGDEWIYFKLYCGTKTADNVLTHSINPFIQRLLKENKIDKWFFIRYADPKEHLRLRFHCVDSNSIQEIIKEEYQATSEMVNQGLIWKIQLDTYNRELERYLWNRIEDAESLFFLDSQMVLQALQTINQQNDNKLRWLFAVRSIDVLLNDFGYSLQEKYTLMDSVRTSYFNEFGADKNLKLSLDKKFRDDRQTINTFLNYSKDFQSPHMSLFFLLKNRSRLNQPIVENVMSSVTPESLNGFLQSIIHMNCNRIFSSKQRMHEMVIYDFLYRYYNSELAIRNKKLN